MENDGDIKELLKKNLENSEESLKILKKINRARKIGGFLKVVKWLVIIGISIGAYYYIEPYLNKVLDTYNQINAGMNELKKTTETINSVPSSLMENIKNLLQKTN